ncbi:hypothetical protein GCM10011391_22500 [Pullulanibacillus camelliae]|uniref:MotA/TolQ/ExbB proton channel domain-containing protein n=1 Tax=Pullulanibacillus camelliae TaxID=1707096 RepID=A0A8J3DUN4_9BACL|nr:hypothetical protein [Pullulanibacillus camelliae]GGE43173.1 hypothetical protein GCM10011391_22500 [Pullulanibacillus camelliae]
MSLTPIIVSAIALLFLIGCIAQIQVSLQLKNWLAAIQRQTQFERFDTPPAASWLRDALEAYKSYRQAGTEVNSQALIEKHLLSERIRVAGVIRTPLGNMTRMLNHLPSFTIILGVLGTFLGLTLAMFSMQGTLLTLGDGSGSGNLSVDTIISAIASPFKGMSLAFITSIAGIGTALLLNLLQAGYFSGGRSLSYLTEHLLTEGELFLDHYVETQLMTEKPKDSFEKILDRLAAKIGDSFEATIGDFSRDMVHFTERLDHSMEELQSMLHNEKERTQAFSEATLSMERSGQSFAKATQSFESSNQGMSKHIQGLQAAIEQAFKRMEAHEKRMEQTGQQAQRLLEQSDKKVETISQQFLRATEQQLENFQDKYDHASSSLQRQQEDWLYQHQDMHNRYAEATDTIANALDQLERSLYQMADKIKREIMDQIKYQNERQQQIASQTDSRQESREIIRHLEGLSRGIEALSHDMERRSSDSVRYLQEFYQLFTRMSQHLELQVQEQQRMRSTLPTRVLDS